MGLSVVPSQLLLGSCSRQQVLLVEDDGVCGNMKTGAACEMKVHEDDLDVGHVKGDEARALTVAHCILSKSGTKQDYAAIAGSLDHKKSWRDVAIQGLMKKKPLLAQ